jgi:hypothetical protein
MKSNIISRLGSWITIQQNRRKREEINNKTEEDKNITRWKIAFYSKINAGWELTKVKEKFKMNEKKCTDK